MVRGRGLRRTLVAAVLVPLAARGLEHAGRTLAQRRPGSRAAEPMQKAGRLLRRFF
jgi:hypothetical protein